jgi:hypothetical protein
MLSAAMPSRRPRRVVPENKNASLVQPLLRHSDHAARDDGGNGGNGDAAASGGVLEAALSSVSCQDSKRKPSWFLNQAFEYERQVEERSKCMRQGLELGAAPSTSWSCRVCTQSDRSKLQLADDKSGWSCTLCGAVDSQCNLQETEYESSTRTTVERGERVGSHMTASEFENVKERNKARIADAGTGTSVPASMREAQNKLTRGVAMEQALCDTLTPRDRKRMEKAMTHVNNVFRSSGLDPDSNPLCRMAFDTTSRIFLKSASHMLVCGNKNRTCVVWMVRSADVRLIAKACIAHVLALADAAVAKEEAFEQIAPFEVNNMKRKLNGEMEAFTKAVGVARDATDTTRRILEATPAALCEPCDDNDAVIDDGDELAVADGTTTNATTVTDPFPLALVSDPRDGDESSAVDSFLEQLATSLLSAKTIGWIDERTLATAQAHVVGVDCYDWVSSKHTWPADVVAAIVCVKTLAQRGMAATHMTTVLKKLAKQHRITMSTVHSALDSMPALPAPLR